MSTLKKPEIFSTFKASWRPQAVLAQTRSKSWHTFFLHSGNYWSRNQFPVGFACTLTVQLCHFCSVKYMPQILECRSSLSLVPLFSRTNLPTTYFSLPLHDWGPSKPFTRFLSCGICTKGEITTRRQLYFFVRKNNSKQPIFVGDLIISKVLRQNLRSEVDSRKRWHCFSSVLFSSNKFGAAKKRSRWIVQFFQGHWDVQKSVRPNVWFDLSSTQLNFNQTWNFWDPNPTHLFKSFKEKSYNI